MSVFLIAEKRRFAGEERRETLAEERRRFILYFVNFPLEEINKFMFRDRSGGRKGLVRSLPSGEKVNGL